MTDLCKAVKAHLDEIDHLVSGADYVTHRLVQERLGDVMELLKAIQPRVDVDTWVCGNCGTRLERQSMVGDNVLLAEQFEYCPHCGRAVKWE